jgi:hypothetical protein
MRLGAVAVSVWRPGRGRAEAAEWGGVNAAAP